MEIEEEKGMERSGKDHIAARRKRRLNQRIYSGDSADNMIAKTIDDSDQMYTYNLTNLKVKELISEVTYTSCQKAAITKSFQQLEKLLLTAKGVEPAKLKTGIPFPPVVSREGLSEFKPPVKVELCGSFAAGLSLSSTMMVDVRLVIPKKYYLKKDYVNGKWLVKKAYYAAVLSHHITSSNRNSYVLHYAYPNENPLDIVLHVTCKKSVTFRIFLHVEPNAFLKKVLAPDRCNVSRQHLGIITGDDEVDIPTPLYNHVLATNQIYGSDEQLTVDWINESGVIRQCMVLTKIWMHQRGLDQGFQCVNAFTVRMFMIYLLRRRQLPYHTTGHQMFIAFLQKIASFDWTKPFSLKEDVTEECLSNHKAVSDFVFLDSTGFVNYCAAVSTESVHQLKQHSKETAALIIKDTERSFGDTFIKKVSPYLYYDYSVRLERVSELVCGEVSRRLDSCDDPVYSCLPKLLKVIRKGLGNRITSLAVSPIFRQTIEVHSNVFPRVPVDDALVIRFHVNPEFIDNTLERGPPADDPAAAEFRSFWGERSDLRRFMDGAICEAVYWKAEYACAKRLIYGRIITYLLKLHCGVADPSCLSFGVNKLNSILKSDSFGLSRNLGSGEEEAVAFQSVYFNLSKQLRSINSLPLGITDVLGLAPACRNTKVYAALPSSAGKKRITMDPTRVICVVEGSKWPNSEDVDAIDTLKMLMLIQMKESLNSIDSLTAFVKEGALTVFQDGYQFDISIMNVGELIRLRNEHTTPITRHKFTECVVLPTLTSILSGLQSEHSTYGAAARLLKKFTGSHLLNSLLPEPITDLIAASVYVNPKPFQVPRCPVVAFLRCLHLIAHHDWVNEPIILNFNEEITGDALADIREEFRVRRNKLPCLSIVTPIDRESLITRPVMPFMLKLVRDVAISCVKDVDPTLSISNWDNIGALFNPDISLVDVLIELKTEKSRRTEFPLKQGKQEVNVYMDPAVMYIKHIQEAFGDKAVILYDINDIKYIGLVWKPGAFHPVPCKIVCGDMQKSARSVVEVDGEPCMVLVIKSVLQDCNVVGKYLVQSITVNSQPN